MRMILLSRMIVVVAAAAAAPLQVMTSSAATPVVQVVSRTTVQRGGHGAYQCYNAPSIVRCDHCPPRSNNSAQQQRAEPTSGSDTGTTAAEHVLVAFLEGRKECHDHNVWMDLLSYHSTDAGTSWSTPVKVHGESDGVHNVTVGAPTAVVDTTTNRLVLLMIRNDPRRKSFDILVSHSDDCGRTFANPRDISAQVKPLAGHLGAPWGFYATTFRAIQLKSGRLMACADHSINKQMSPYPIITNHAHVVYSDDHGTNWKLGGVVAMNSSDECSIAQLSSGTIVMNIRNYVDQTTGRIDGEHGYTPGHIVRALADSTDQVCPWHRGACAVLASLSAQLYAMSQRLLRRI